MTETVIIYHQVKDGVDCPDGVTASWVAHRRYPTRKVWGWTYQSEPPNLEEEGIGAGDRVIIVDFSFPASVMQQWDAGIEVMVIDHHQTAINNLSGLTDHILAKFDLNECGATLAWKTLFPDEEMPYFLNHVRDRDLWDFLLPETDAVHEAVAQLRFGLKYSRDVLFKLFDGLANLDKESLHKFLLPIGEPLVEPKRRKVEEVASRHEWRTLEMPYPEIFAGDFFIPVVELAKDGSEDRLTSDVCMYLYRQFPGADFTACITSDGSWSLRSDKHGNNFNVRIVAEQFNGGGHHNAAGFKREIVGGQ